MRASHLPNTYGSYCRLTDDLLTSYSRVTDDLQDRVGVDTFEIGRNNVMFCGENLDNEQLDNEKLDDEKLDHEKLDDDQKLDNEGQTRS